MTNFSDWPCSFLYPKAWRTRELSAEQKFTRDHWRKQVPPVCGDVLRALVHACHVHRIFNMLNHFFHESMYSPRAYACMRARKAITFQCRSNSHA